MAQPFIRLADPATYQACDWDLSQDESGRVHWAEFFKRHINTILTLALDARQTDEERAQQVRRELTHKLDVFLARPQAFGRVTMLDIDRWRDHTLRAHDIHDAFDGLKARENERMLPRLCSLCDQLDTLSGGAQLRALIDGIFAGNIFDMGAEATAKAFLGQSPDFITTRSSLAPRPWLTDDYDVLASRLLDHIHRRAVFFIDNAGSDFLLGAVPFIRWMAKRGTHVVIAANEFPTLNDMTIHDVQTWWPRVVSVQPDLKALPIELCSTGTGDPLIDLSQVSPALNDASRDADLIILEGMGRDIESNLDARFNCDALNIAMIKDPVIGKRLGGKTFDLVCRFR
jgi:type II pantothenate kinase